MLEIEIKARLADPGAFRRLLLEAGAVLVRERHREDNTLYDFPGRPLTARRQALRLRSAGRISTLTFKGAPRASRRFKIRTESETGVRDARQMRRILKALGLQPVFRYVKKRTVFRLNKVVVSVDEMVLGAFVELEGERPEIVRLARKLGIAPSEWIRRDYVQMMIESGYPRGSAAYSSSRSEAPSSSGSSSSSPSSSDSAASSS